MTASADAREPGAHRTTTSRCIRRSTTMTRITTTRTPITAPVASPPLGRPFDRARERVQVRVGHAGEAGLRLRGRHAVVAELLRHDLVLERALRHHHVGVARRRDAWSCRRRATARGRRPPGPTVHHAHAEDQERRGPEAKRRGNPFISNLLGAAQVRARRDSPARGSLEQLRRYEFSRRRGRNRSSARRRWRSPPTIGENGMLCCSVAVALIGPMSTTVRCAAVADAAVDEGEDAQHHEYEACDSSCPAPFRPWCLRPSCGPE